MNTPRSAVVVVAALMLTNCSLDPSSSLGQTEAIQLRDLARHIEIEVDDLNSGLPCSVVDRPDATTRNVLWHAEFEAGFCQRKAEETRLILQSRGWACRPESVNERLDLAKLKENARPSKTRHVVAAWLCLEGLSPTKQVASIPPPVPIARPDRQESPAAPWGNEALRAAVEADLSVIGQDVLDDQTVVDAALGDLDDDDIRDAAVILTRESDRRTPHRLLLAYLRNGEDYNLVDVWILSTPDNNADNELSLMIEDGRVQLDYCCESNAKPTVLVLDNRKLAYANGH